MFASNQVYEFGQKLATCDSAALGECYCVPELSADFEIIDLPSPPIYA